MTRVRAGGVRPAALVRGAAALAVAALAVTASCGGPQHQIVEDRWEIAEASGAPEISEITDLGGTDVPLRGQLPLGGSDGVAAIGETLWIHGSSFGRQPAVSVGGRPAAVLGRTRDGGAVVRVPVGTPPGPQPVAVSNERGKGEKSVTIRRYGALMPADGGKVGWVELTADGPVAAGETAAAGARLLALSADGRAAYVADPRRSSIDVLEIPAPLTPRSIYKVDLDAQPVIALSAAPHATLLAVVRAGDVVLLDTTSPLHPARSAPRAFPPAVRDAHVVAAELSPDGQALAALTGEGNRLLLLDMVPRGRAPVVADLSLAPETRVSVLIDVAFSPDGQTLWVLAGDTTSSRGGGPQPTVLYAVRRRGGGHAQATLELARTISISAAADPARVATGRALPLASGAAIRLPPEKATVFLSARAGVFRVDAEDAATEAVAAPGLVGRVDLSPDGRWLLAPAVGPGGGGMVIAVPADGRPGARKSVAVTASVTRGAGTAAAPRPPELRIQP